MSGRSESERDLSFEIEFYETVLRRDRGYSEVVEILGGLYTKAGRFADGLRMDRRLVRRQPANPTAHYNLACSLALCGRPEAAVRSLRQAVHLGYRDFGWMAADDDLRSLRGRRDFQELIERIKAPD